MGFPRQEYWKGLSFPPPVDLPLPRIKPASSALAGGFFTTELPGKLYVNYISIILKKKENYFFLNQDTYKAPPFDWAFKVQERYPGLPQSSG